MIKKMDKKGGVSGILNAAFIWAIIGVIILFIVMGTGGIKVLSNIVGFMAKIPAIIWVVIGIILLFKMIGGRRR